MNYGFIKVCAATPKIKVADTKYNGEQIRRIITKCRRDGVKITVFPELCITGYTCEDLFFQNSLLSGAKEELFLTAESTKGMDQLVCVGLPLMKEGKLFNTAAVLFEGKILGIIPKLNIPNYSEFYEARHFSAGNQKTEWVCLGNGYEKIPFGSNILFPCENESLRDLILGVEICEDLWVPIPPSSHHALAGASIIANLSASDETAGKDSFRRELVKSQSSRLISGYIYADAGEGESTTDLVFGAQNMIGENGTILKEADRFSNERIVSEIDLERLMSERRRITTFQQENGRSEEREREAYTFCPFSFQDSQSINLSREIPKMPFIPSQKAERDMRCHEILKIQALGLKKRMEHANMKCAVLGLSGGLDSTLALLVTTKAYDMLALEKKQIIAVTMPCFGTTDRTYQNAIKLSERLGVTLKEIPIGESVCLHFKDIGHDPDNHNVIYENAQARMRTQILMDLANGNHGLVIGTGDMSELALGWATYNGDHMSMYGVNSSVPKTLVRHLISYCAELETDIELKSVLEDILETPVSPELLPPKDGFIAQKTEDIVGPYELHDFYLYYMLRFGFSPKKIAYLASEAFMGNYKKTDIIKWLKVFYQRFFSQQFKRSCLPDGPKVGSVAISPRGDLRMPSDACVRIWMEEISTIE